MIGQFKPCEPRISNLILKIYVELHVQVQKRTIQVRCIGGGRIQKTANSVTVYGYSIGFGRPDHSVACDAIKKSYPDLKVEWNNDGY